MSVKSTIIEILNCFENDSSSPKTEYDKIYIYHDGTDNKGQQKKKQVTLGRGYTSMGGTLWDVFRAYQTLGGDAKKLLSFLPQRYDESLASNKDFLSLIIKTAQTDEKLRTAEDQIYDKLYWDVGYNWYTINGFSLPLSLAVIQDTFLQSGSMLSFLTKRFTEKTPAHGGDEKAWIEAYVSTRQKWLANHSNSVLRGTVYRTNFFTKQIENNNWNLDKFPIYPNDTKLVA